MTNVTATIKDPAGNIYANALVIASFVGQNNTPGIGPYLINGAPTGQFNPVVPTEADSAGNLAISLPGNDIILPSPSQWKFSVVSNTAPAVSFSVLITISGAVQDISAALQAAAAPLFPSVSFTNVGLINFTEQAAPAGAVGHDILWGDSTSHRLKTNPNNTGAVVLADFADDLGVFAPTTSARLAAVMTDATGVGSLVFANGPTIAPVAMSGFAVVYADRFANIQAAINALPAAGGVVDARSPNTNLAMGALDAGSNSKPITLLLGPFTYTFTQITVRQGFNILGAGFLNTVLSNVGTNANPAFVIPQVNNNAITIHWADFQVLGLAGNTSQDGIFFDATNLTNAGVELSTFTNLQFTGFLGATIHLKATLNGVSGSIGAIQGCSFFNVTAIRPATAVGATQNALRIEGSCGQLGFWNCWFTGAANDTGTNVFVGTSGTAGPYSCHFHDTTNQNGFAYIFDGGNSNTTEHDHFENIKGCYNLANTGQLFVGLNFKTPFINANVGVNAGNGYIINIPNTVINGDVTLDSPFLGVAPDNLVKNLAGNNCSVTVLNPRTFNSATPANTWVSSGISGTLAPAATVDLKSWTSVQATPSATSMITFKSNLAPGQTVTIYASGGSIQFATGGNLALGNNLSPFIVGNGDSATFMRVDAGAAAFILVAYTQQGKAVVDLTGQTANIGSTLLYAVQQSGLYRITVYIIVTSVGTTSTMPNVVLGFTDPDNNTVQSVPFTTTSAGNTLTTLAVNSLPLRAKAGTNINFSTTGYASTGAAMQYALHVRLEPMLP